MFATLKCNGLNVCPPMKQSAPHIRPAAQAGRFYDAHPARLRQSIEDALARPVPPLDPLPRPPAMILAPHAGYVFSGAVAAAAYRHLRGLAYDGVVVLGPSHYEDFSGAGLPSYHGFATPLGDVPIDRPAIDDLSGIPDFAFNDAAHDPEHSIEVELPFLQVVLAGPFRLAPILFGRADLPALERIAAALHDLLARRRAAGERWLLVVSSDTYHGYDREACRANDQALTRFVSRMDGRAGYEALAGRRLMACGWRPLVAAMLLLEREGGRTCRVTARSDSSEASGRDEGYLVGYVSAIAG